MASQGYYITSTSVMPIRVPRSIGGGLAWLVLAPQAWASNETSVLSTWPLIVGCAAAAMGGACVALFMLGFWGWRTRRRDVFRAGRFEYCFGLTGQKERLQFLVSILDATDDAIIGTSLEGAIMSWNRGAEHMFGHSASDMIGQPVVDLFMADHRSSFIERFAMVREQSETAHIELPHHRPEGERTHLSLTLGAIQDDQGAVEGVAIMARDITAWTQTKAEHRMQQQQLIQAEKLASLGVLVGGIAHEINNPNSFIMMNAFMVRDVWTSVRPILDQYQEEMGDFVVGGLPYSKMRDQAPELISGIEEGAERIKYVVNELREFAFHGPDDLLEDIHLNHVVESAMTLLSAMIKRTARRIEVSFGDNLPPVYGHYRRIEQVIINLLQNACQALPDRDRIVWVSTDCAVDRKSVVLTVRDEGCGIPSENLSRVMDPFFTTKRDEGHTGLGLSVSATIVRDHRGTLTFDSELGSGTTATLTLPIANGLF